MAMRTQDMNARDEDLCYREMEIQNKEKQQNQRDHEQNQRHHEQNQREQFLVSEKDMLLQICNRITDFNEHCKNVKHDLEDMGVKMETPWLDDDYKKLIEIKLKLIRCRI